MKSLNIIQVLGFCFLFTSLFNLLSSLTILGLIPSSLGWFFGLITPDTVYGSTAYLGELAQSFWYLVASVLLLITYNRATNGRGKTHV